jgi:hypothetical protein
MWLKLQENDVVNNYDQKDPGEGKYGRIHGVVAKEGNSELQNSIVGNGKPISVGWP